MQYILSETELKELREEAWQGDATEELKTAKAFIKLVVAERDTVRKELVRLKAKLEKANGKNR
jgi:hypothetical protein